MAAGVVVVVGVVGPQIRQPSAGSQASIPVDDTPTPAQETIPQDVQAELGQSLAEAHAAMTAFWGDFPHAQVTHGAYATFTAPALLDGVGVYDGATGTSRCGGERLPPGNAFYCLPDDVLAFDVGLLGDRFADLGDGFVRTILAHEYAHAIQHRWGPAYTRNRGELQADCLAGAALYGAADAGLLVLGTEDEREIISALAAVADEHPVTRPDGHGDAFQRIEAFDIGRQGGVTACLPR